MIEQAICSGKEISVNGMEEGFQKLYYGKPLLVYMQCSYEMLANAECQHATAVQTYNIGAQGRWFCGTLVICNCAS